MRISARFIVRFAVGLVLAFALAAGCAPAAGADPVLAESQGGGGGARGGGLLPLAPDWLAYTYDADMPTVLAESDLPASFDLRAEGMATGVKDQTPFNACWAFGALGSLESNALVSGEAPLEGWAGYSERHLAWFAYEPLLAGEQAGEGVVPADVGSASPIWGPVYHMAAGTSYLALTALASWEGAEDGAAVPYSDDLGTVEPGNESWRVDESLRFDSVDHLTDVDFLPTPVTEEGDSYVCSWPAIEAVKRSILENGAVSASYYAEQSSPGAEPGSSEYFNRDTWSSCVTNVDELDAPFVKPNHVITVVGWDDSYSKSNFAEGHQPAGDGAWIVKNSWGTGSWGIPDGNGKGTGYFHLSYYDESAGEFMSFQGDGAADGFDYETSYQHDFLGMSAMLVEEEHTRAGRSTANVFVAQEEGEVGAVSSVAMRPGMSVSAQVYLLGEDASDPADGELVASAFETFAFSGYHTMELDVPVEVSVGQRFSVVETITSLAEDGSMLYQSYFENGPADETSSRRWSELSRMDTTVVVHEGESFLYEEGAGWTDVVDLDTVGCRYDSSVRVEYGNALIKAFANGREEEPEPNEPDEPVVPDEPDPDGPGEPNEPVVPSEPEPGDPDAPSEPEPGGSDVSTDAESMAKPLPEVAGEQTPAPSEGSALAATGGRLPVGIAMIAVIMLVAVILARIRRR
ncbi:hypothetical protein GS424_010895 [Eggerthella guodeyinii]|uniref:Peptidase C1A papain C-terminal domain-containing protein n=1 Tax=Eggerthella guodeyinii TaxID=2690837 RepID=A0A6L7IS55_9ACTN|nr:lectin like domain-containing protein [Eggerthella guodeyinii]QOS67051.1 hypothetical protein GS424_010895 [Eggerthella guodeyinii]